MISVHVKKLKRRVELSADEERAIRTLAAESRKVKADEVLVRSGEELNSGLILLDGWLARCKDLAGGERQVMQLHVPGDFPDLHGFTLRRLDHDIVAMTDSRVAIVPYERLRGVTGEHPRLANVYWQATNIDAAITRELALSLGQRSAIARMSHLFCELHERLNVVDRVQANGYELPLTQRELAECLGLTVVHANRTLQELRRRGLVDFLNHQLTIHDRRGLEGLAEFDRNYLYLEKRPL